MKRLYLFIAFVISLMLTAGCCVYNVNSTYIGRVPIANVTEHLNNSTVALLTEKEGLYYTTCTGVWINNTDILTARHCVADDDEDDPVSVGKLVKYQTYKEFDRELGALKKFAYYGFVLTYDRANEQDLAIVRSIDNVAHSVASIYGGKIQIGENIRVVGHPMQLDYTHVHGNIAQIRTGDFPYDNQKLIQISADVWFGNSGGGLFSMDGELMGITSFIMIGRKGFTTDEKVAAFFVHRDKIVDFLSDQDIKFTY